MDEEKYSFHAKVTPTQELYKEAYQTVIWHSWRPYLFIGLMLACLFLAGKALYDGDYRNPSTISFAIYFLLLAVYPAWRLLSTPTKAARKYMKRLSEVFGEKVDCTNTYSFGDNAYHIHTANGGDVDTAYSQIKSIYETKHGIVLKRAQDLFEVLDKSTVQGGSLQEFRGFLEQKMSGAKFSWKHNA